QPLDRLLFKSLVISALVAGIQLTSCSSAYGWLDPGHKARDDCVVAKNSRLKEQRTGIVPGVSPAPRWSPHRANGAAASVIIPLRVAYAGPAALWLKTIRHPGARRRDLPHVLLQSLRMAGSRAQGLGSLPLSAENSMLNRVSHHSPGLVVDQVHVAEIGGQS